MLAKVNGLFRLTRDMETQYTASGVAVGKLGLACSEKYKDKETQLFLDATVFGKTSEILQQYAGTKGTQIYLSGKLQTESWDDKNTGQKRYKTTMIVEGFDFVSNGQTQQQAPQPHQNIGQPQPMNQQANQQAGNFQQPQAPQYQPNDFSDDDCPF